MFAVRAPVKRRARPSSLSLVRLVSRLACGGVAAICPLQEMVKGIQFHSRSDWAGSCRVLGRLESGVTRGNQVLSLYIQELAAEK